MLKIIVLATLTSLFGISAVSALPVPSPMSGVSQSSIPELLLVQDRRPERRDGDMRRGSDSRRTYIPGRRYDGAPSGWSRYGNRRPGNWRTRRCIMVGPIWFCP